MISIISYIIIFLGAATMYLPSSQLKDSKRLSGKELSKKYPEHKWMRWGFISMYLGWIAAALFFFYKVLPLVYAASFLSALFASIGLYIGLFAIITGVSILPMRSPRILYVVGDEARKAGRFQVTCSLVVIFITFAVEAFR